MKTNRVRKKKDKKRLKLFLKSVIIITTINTCKSRAWFNLTKERE